MLIAAVRSGADAVYMGFSNFNARRSADNFDNQAFIKAVKYAKARGVKVYLTLNTILSDNELPQALEVARMAYSAGAAAAIVQDIGLARLIREQLPLFPIHASTQLTAHSPAALPLLKSLGFSRVVVSREMSRDELKEFTRAARELSMEVEVFVHGALCMSMSGQCYMSAMLGGRSGNRGLCAGPCRLPFAAEGGTGYDLSLKDLSLIEYIDELKEMGVASLKIEGRMTRPEYVAAATAVCRKTVDGEECEALKETLRKVFSRSGFTSGYYENRLGKDMFGIRTRDDVMLSAEVINSLHELYRRERQSVAIFGSFSLPEIGAPATLTVSDGENEVSVSGGCAEAAKNRPVDEEFLRGKLEKTGGTPFYFEKLEFHLGEGLAIGGAVLGSLRREALEKLLALRMKDIPAPKIDLTAEEQKKQYRTPKFLGVFSHIKNIPEDISGLSAIAVPIEEPFENLSLPIPLYITLPRGIGDEEFLLSRLEVAKENGIEFAFCGNIAAVTLCQKAGVKPWFDFSMNIFNSHSAKTAEQLSAGGITVSPEAKCDMINAIHSPVPTAFIAYGRLPLMLTRNCPQKNGVGCAACSGLTDRKGIVFPVSCRGGYSEIYNSRPIYLAERIDEFSTDYAILLFTLETPEECREIISRYRNGSGAEGDYTRGLYYRGVE